MVRMLASIAVDRGFEPPSGQTNDYKTATIIFLSLVKNKPRRGGLGFIAV